MQRTSFNSCAPQIDHLLFGRGDLFVPSKVAAFLQLDQTDVSRIALVPSASVRWGEDVPRVVKERLGEIGATANLVSDIFRGDVAKTALWFHTKNPLLGGSAPRDMIRLGRHDRLRRFIVAATLDTYTQRGACNSEPSPYTLFAKPSDAGPHGRTPTCGPEIPQPPYGT